MPREHLPQILKWNAALLTVLTITGSAFAQNPMTSFCSPGVAGVIPCPCSNPPSSAGRGCDNSSATGGAVLTASGAAALLGDTLVFTASGMKPSATSIVLQGTGASAAGAPFGQGVSCLTGNLKILYVKKAVAGSIVVPSGLDPRVSARSAALGDPISTGMTRYYAVCYRDPIVVGGCGSVSTFSVTQGGSVLWSNTDPLMPSMVPISAGTFQMGSNAAAGAPYFNDPTTQPVHQVSISYNFSMGATEVTQAQYYSLLGGGVPPFPNHPIHNLTWAGCQAYCAALTAQQSALGNVPTGYQYRLPTEAEWEYACRAGTTTEFNVGATLFCANANIGYSSHSTSFCNTNGSLPVGSYAPNAWGLYDMHGNVAEWCLDSYAPYSAGSVTDPFFTGGPTRVVRGGSYVDFSQDSRSASRYGSNSTSALLKGFRVVLAPVLVP